MNKSIIQLNKLLTIFFLEVGGIGIALAILFFLGQLIGHSWLLFSLALASYIFWHLYHLLQLLKSLSSQHILPASIKFGIWKEIWIQLQTLKKNNTSKQNQLITDLDNYRIFINKIPDAVIIINIKTKEQKNIIEWFNKSAQSTFNLKNKKHTGSHINDIFTELTDYDFSSSKNNKQRLTIHSPGEQNKIFSWQVIPYHKSFKLLLFRDISRLYWINKMRKNFIANVSHELRTPLTVISGYLETFETHFKKDKKYLPAIQSMKQQSVRMNNLIQDLLVLSKLESDTGKLKKKKLVDVPKIIENIINDTHMLTDKKYQIDSNIDNSLMLLGYENEIQSMISNLINNAIRYTPENSIIKVSWYGENKNIFFSVEDNGDGIEKQHLQHLTERFYRVDKGRSRHEGGTGLGLSIVKHILNHHNAKLKIKSQPGKGSQFTCCFNH